LPVRCSIGTAQDALAGEHHPTTHKMQLVVEVNLQRRQNVFLWKESLLNFLATIERKISRKGQNSRYFNGH
jgi:hypothetical protein